MVENLQPWQSTSESLEIKNTKVTVTASVVLSYMRLLRRGAAPTTAARFIGISHEMVNSVQMLLGEVESKIRSRTERAGRAPMQSLLTLISHAEWQSISALCERASPHSDNDGKPVDLSQAITMVSENRQLVMWKESQFDQVAVFIKYFELAEDLRVLQTKPLHSVVANWLMKYIPAAMSEAPASATGVDPVEEGIPPQQIKYRCSLVIRSTDSKYITTGYGMLLLWVIFLVTLSK